MSTPTIVKVSATWLAIVVATLLAGDAQAATVNGRERHQHERIASGIRSGQLSAGEAARLAARAASIARQEARMRASRGLSACERHILNARLDRLSSAIWREKHDCRHR